MKRMNLFWLVPLILVMGACTIHMPFDMDSGYDFYTYHIVFQIAPDDADILLDGRLIGAAYEFATPESALELQGRRHDIVVKREGYREAYVDLRAYNTRSITVRLTLRPEGPAAPAVAPAEPAPEARTVQPKPLPEEAAPAPPAESDEPAVGDAVPVTLEIQPAESAIYLEGGFWGIAPPTGRIDNLRLKPGQYTLEVIKPGYAPAKKIFTVANQPLKIVIVLKKN